MTGSPFHVLPFSGKVEFYYRELYKKIERKMPVAIKGLVEEMHTTIKEMNVRLNRMSSTLAERRINVNVTRHMFETTDQIRDFFAKTEGWEDRHTAIRRFWAAHIAVDDQWPVFAILSLFSVEYLGTHFWPNKKYANTFEKSSRSI